MSCPDNPQTLFVSFSKFDDIFFRIEQMKERKQKEIYVVNWVENSYWLFIGHESRSVRQKWKCLMEGGNLTRRNPFKHSQNNWRRKMFNCSRLTLHSEKTANVSGGIASFQTSGDDCASNKQQQVNGLTFISPEVLCCEQMCKYVFSLFETLHKRFTSK